MNDILIEYIILCRYGYCYCLYGYLNKVCMYLESYTESMFLRDLYRTYLTSLFLNLNQTLIQYITSDMALAIIRHV